MIYWGKYVTYRDSALRSNVGLAFQGHHENVSASRDERNRMTQSYVVTFFLLKVTCLTSLAKNSALNFSASIP